MARYSALRWQFWLYLLRLVSFSGLLGLNTCIHAYEPSFGCTPLGSSHQIPRLGCLFYFLVAPVIVIVNDVAMLVWDAIFSGSFIATACFQTVVSLLVVIFLTLPLRIDPPVMPGDYFLDSIWRGVAFKIPAMVATLVLIASTLLACRKKPIRGWMQGMKELAIRLPPNQPISMFGKRRQADDGIRIVWTGACGWAMKSLKLGLIRRVPEIETLQYTLWRNLTALMLTCILFVQAIWLFIGVIHQPYEIKQIWEEVGHDVMLASRIVFEWTVMRKMNITTFTPIQGLHARSSVTVTMYELLRSGLEMTFDYSDLSLSFNFAGNDVISIGKVGIPLTADSAEIELYLGPSPDRMLLDDSTELRISNTPYAFAPRVKLANGIHMFGSLTLMERRLMQPSFAEMIGVSAPIVSVLVVGTEIHQTYQHPLENQSIARVTLTLNHRRFWPVLVDQRQRTLIDALGSIGGLLAIFQGIHVLLFGQPLWWGLLGSKIIDPFGLCGARSTSVRKRMIARYGYIPTAENAEDGASADHRLRLFLNDFVIDMGLLVSEDSEVIDEVPDVGEVVVNPPGSPSRDVDVEGEGGDTGTGISTEGRDTSV